ncbi:hypothetical protein [Altericista sp. CCNU0014]
MRQRRGDRRSFGSIEVSRITLCGARNSFIQRTANRPMMVSCL